MYERLSPALERVIKHANDYAREYAQDYVGTEHLLLGILRDGGNTAASLLAARGVTEAKAREAVDRLIKQSLEDTWVLGRLPGTPNFRNVIATAIEEARQWESREVEPEHLLLALLQEKGSTAYSALTELGVKAGEIRAALNKP